MNVLTFTSLWPNAEQPNFGVFVKHRVAAMARLNETPGGVNVRVVAPVPYFPKPLAALSGMPAPWRFAAQTPEVEKIGGLTTFHPRYPMTPKIGMRFYGSWMAAGAWQTVRRLHAEEPFNLIDAHYVYPDGFAAIELGRRLNIPVIISARGTDISLFSHMPHIWPKIVNTLNRAAGVIAVSGALKERMVELGIIGRKIAVIPNGIDSETFHLRDRETARRKLGLALEDRIILTVGALIPRKGIDRLIDAMAMLHSKSLAEGATPLKLFAIGEGEERRSLQSQISSLELQDYAFLPGAKPQAELADWYAAADLFCLASHREGCPNVVVEAMACGLPVVVAEMDGIREFVDMSRGRVVSNPSAENFAASIKEALLVKWDREALARLGGARSWDRVGAEVIDVFRSIITTQNLPQSQPHRY